MELRHLDHLIEAIERGTIGRAAESLGLSQPALTKSIRNLETLLQVKLLERRSRGVIPTAYGEAVLARGKSVRIELRKLVHDIQSLRSGIGARVRIGVTQGVACRLVPAATIRLVTEHPKTQFSVWTGTTNELIPMLANGDIDFVIAPLGRHDLASRIVEEFLFDDRPVIVVGPKHPLSRKKAVQPKELTNYRWVLPRATTPLRGMLDQIFMSANVLPPIPTIECDSALYVKSVLMENDFVGFLPRDEITVEERFELLKGVLFRTDVPARPIGILRRSGVLNASSMQLIMEIKRLCIELGYVAQSQRVRKQR